MMPPQDGCKPHVCRRLFVEEEGDEPQEEGENRTNRFVEELHGRHVTDFKARYNFDPQTERPLPGNFEWYERKTRDGEWVKMPIQDQQQQQLAEEEQTERETEPGVEDVRQDDREEIVEGVTQEDEQDVRIQHQ